MSAESPFTEIMWDLRNRKADEAKITALFHQFVPKNNTELQELKFLTRALFNLSLDEKISLDIDTLMELAYSNEYTYDVFNKNDLEKVLQKSKSLETTKIIQCIESLK